MFSGAYVVASDPSSDVAATRNGRNSTPSGVTMFSGTSTCTLLMWHKQAIGYATGAFAGNVAANDGGSAVAADITWHGDRASYFVNNMMSGGACLIDDTGVIKGTVDDTAALPTS